MGYQLHCDYEYFSSDDDCYRDLPFQLDPVIELKFECFSLSEGLFENISWLIMDWCSSIVMGVGIIEKLVGITC